ncbi:MAG: hypothetical protein R3178_03955, partial [Rhodothermales bacterium]|nr:hypothetical protein [Rhodothermales bacterium]
MEDRECALGNEAALVCTPWIGFRAIRAVCGAVLIIGALFSTSGCRGTQEDERSHADPAVDRPGTRTAVIFAPGTISTGLNERDATMSSDGAEFYFTLWAGGFGTIMVSEREANGWTKPRVASFSGLHSDLEPFVVPDGSRLVFASTRPTVRDSSGTDYNIWFVERMQQDWGPPKLVTELADEEGNEYYPSESADGVLYFTAKRTGGTGGEDIWRAIPNADGYGRIEPVPGGINTGRDEFNAFV